MPQQKQRFKKQFLSLHAKKKENYLRKDKHVTEAMIFTTKKPLKMTNFILFYNI